MKIFRGESDFLLVSKLSDKQQRQRHVDVDVKNHSTGGYLMASVYEVNVDDTANDLGTFKTESGAIVKVSRTLLAKIILAIIDKRK